MKTILRIVPFLALAAVAAGCGVKAETYVMTKQRADIVGANTYNGGFLMGKPQYMEPQKKTRKVYVLEVSKPAKESETKVIKQETTVTTHEVRVQEAAPAAAEQAPPAGYNQGIVTTGATAEQAQAASAAPVSPLEVVTYTVQKDDTLQKIAKKFYGSYGKWIKIYDANKEKLKNPNFVKPGTVLTIPAEK